MIDIKAHSIPVHVEGELYRRCPRCGAVWTDRQGWVDATTHVETSGGPTTVAAAGRTYQGYIEHSTREHHGCGGQMRDEGRLWRAIRPIPEGL